MSPILRPAAASLCSLLVVACAAAQPASSTLVAPLAARAIATPSAPPDVGPAGTDPRSVSVRIEAVDVGTTVRNVTSRLEPELSPLRDARILRLRTTLAANWTRATRGLGAMTVTSSSPDLVVYVVPARGSSFQEISSDGARRVVLFVVGDLGDSAEYVDMTALHELGHLWCCYGPDAGPDGHWGEKIADPQLAGVDRFGLMTHPVECWTKSGVVIRCPTLFSDRELRTMGFSDLPPAPTDP